MMRRTLFWLVNFEAVFMPALSPSMETGTIVEWKKKVGELVKEGDLFCTVQTDKAVVDYTNTFEAGYLAKIYCQNGQTAPVASTIAVMVDDAADVGKADEYSPDGAVAAAEEAPAAPAPPAAAAAPASSSPSGTSSEPPAGVSVEAVFMPALSPSMETGTIVEWKKKVGELVKEGEVFCTVQTDKAVVDYTNTFEAGYLAKIYCQNGQTADVSKTIAVMVAEAADVEKVQNYHPEDAVGAPAAAAPASAAPVASAASAAAPKAASGTRYGSSLQEAIAASGPSVMRIAAGLDDTVVDRLSPSGKGGRFIKSDFAGLPGFDYNDATPALALTKSHASSSSSSSAAAAKTSAVAGPTPVVGGIYDVLLQAGQVFKRVDDSKLLKNLISAMPKPKAAKASK